MSKAWPSNLNILIKLDRDIDVENQWIIDIFNNIGIDIKMQETIYHNYRVLKFKSKNDLDLAKVLILGQTIPENLMEAADKFLLIIYTGIIKIYTLRPFDITVYEKKLKK